MRKRGRLLNPGQRHLQLLGLRGLTLAVAGKRLGVSAERARQLFNLYGIIRHRRRPTRKNEIRVFRKKSGT